MRNLAFLPLVLLTACQAGVPDPRGVDHDETLLTVSATGRSETRPDEASMTLGVDSLAGSAAEATALNNAKMQKVASALAAFGVGKDDMQTSNLSLQRIDYGKDRGRFRASNQLTVRVTQVEKAGDAVLAATEAGANVMSGPRLRVRDSEKAALSAYGNAYRAARARAEAYAKASGMEISRVLAIRDGGQAGGEPITMQAEDSRAVMMAPPTVDAAAPPPPPFNPGMNSSTVSVRVDFALKG